ncbi:MAG TPA: cation transporter, partial [Paraburkholderia sp.]
MNISLMALQIGVAWMANSHALFADGIHTLVDLAADAILLASLHLRSIRAQRQPHKAPGRILTTQTFTSVLLIVAGTEQLWRSFAPSSGEVQSATSIQIYTLMIGIVAVATKECLFRYFRSLSLHGDDSGGNGADILTAGAW